MARGRSTRVSDGPSGDGFVRGFLSADDDGDAGNSGDNTPNPPPQRHRQRNSEPQETFLGASFAADRGRDDVERLRNYRPWDSSESADDSSSSLRRARSRSLDDRGEPQHSRLSPSQRGRPPPLQLPASRSFLDDEPSSAGGDGRPLRLSSAASSQNMNGSPEENDRGAPGSKRPSGVLRLYYLFRRFWLRNRPNDWSGESDPQTVWLQLVNLLTLLGVAMIVLIMPALLNVVAPYAPPAPGASPTIGDLSSVARGRSAAVAAEHESCSELGVRAIEHLHGNAADAAVVATFCQAVLHPFSSSLAGGAMLLYRDAKKGASTVFDARSTVPKSAVQNLGTAHSEGVLVGVPGLVRGLKEFHDEHGSLQWRDLLSEVIPLASSAPVSKALAEKLQDAANLILANPLLSAVFSREIPYESYVEDVDDISNESGMPGQRVVLQVGDDLRQPALEQTLKHIAEHGAAAMYDGDDADAMVRTVRNVGGHLSGEDLKSYHVVQRKPISWFVNGYRLLCAPPPSTCAVVASALNILEGFRLRRQGRNGSAYQCAVEAIKLALARMEELGDPEFIPSMEAVVRSMLDKSEAETLRSRIDASEVREQEYYKRSDHILEEAGTGTQVSVIDNDGNAASISATMGGVFGSLIFVNDTGVILNNELLNLRGGINVSAGMRPRGSLLPMVVLDADQPKYVLGAGGGLNATHALILSAHNLVEYGDDIGSAIAAPRLQYDDRTYTVKMESIDPESCTVKWAFPHPGGTSFEYWTNVCERLKLVGHNVTSVPDAVGTVQGVASGLSKALATTGEDAVRTFFACSDPRTPASLAAAV